MLAIVFACEIFYYFGYEGKFNVHSDHKTLENLMNRDIHDVTPRLQRTFSRLLKYPSMTIAYKPGKEMLVADCLSRASLSSANVFDNEMTTVIHSITRRVCSSKGNYEQYKEILSKDENSRIAKYVRTFWPPYHQLDDLSQRFYEYKDELHF